MAGKSLKLAPLHMVAIAALAIILLAPGARCHFPQRLASLAPSITEMLYTIDAQSQLIGVSSFCDFPPDAKNKTIVGSFTSCNLERLKRLQPDKILLVSGQESIAKQLQHNQFSTVIFPNHHLVDIAANLTLLGALTGHEKLAHERSENFKNALDALRGLNSSKPKTKVFFCVFQQPLIAVGKNGYLHDAIEISGGESISSAMPQDYPHFSLERLVLSDPDVIILPYEARGQSMLQTAPWTKLKAIKSHRYYFLPPPADDSLSRPTPRTLEGLYWLSCKLHPELSQQLSEWKKRWIR